MNMAYVRFENTSRDLADCEQSMDDEDISEREKEARLRLIKICVRIADDYGDELEKSTKAKQ